MFIRDMPSLIEFGHTYARGSTSDKLWVIELKNGSHIRRINRHKQMAPENENNSWDELVDSLELPQENESDSPKESSSSEEEASSDRVVGDITPNVREASGEEMPEIASEDSGDGEPEAVNSADDQAGEGDSAENSGEAEEGSIVVAQEEAEEVQVAENTDSAGSWDSLASEFGLESESPVVIDAAENDQAKKDEEGTSIDSQNNEKDSDEEGGFESAETVKQSAEAPADKSEVKASWDDLATSFGLEPEPDAAEATDSDGEVTAVDSVVQADSAPENQPDDIRATPSQDDNGARGGDEKELGSALEAASTEDETAKAIDDLFASFQPADNEAEEILADVESVVEKDSETESLTDSGDDKRQSLEASEEASSDSRDEEPISEAKEKAERPKQSRKKNRGNKPVNTDVAEADDNSASEDTDTERKRNIPTWDDTIHDLIESNIARHKNSSRGRGPSRRKG